MLCLSASSHAPMWSLQLQVVSKKCKVGLNWVDALENLPMPHLKLLWKCLSLCCRGRTGSEVVLHKFDKLWLQRNGAPFWKQSSVTTVLSCVLVKQEIHVVSTTIMPAGYGGSSTDYCQPHQSTHKWNTKDILEKCSFYSPVGSKCIIIKKKVFLQKYQQ